MAPIDYSKRPADYNTLSQKQKKAVDHKIRTQTPYDASDDPKSLVRKPRPAGFKPNHATKTWCEIHGPANHTIESCEDWLDAEATRQGLPLPSVLAKQQRDASKVEKRRKKKDRLMGTIKRSSG